MSHVMRKPAFSNAKTKAQISCAVIYKDSTVPLLPNSKISRLLQSIVCGCTAPVVSDLVGILEDRFSCDTAMDFISEKEERLAREKEEEEKKPPEKKVLL